ncbi:MAG: hypothetical protein K2Y23_05065 [Cyanobacteria bacterium]|nr:hypothetical protein [Cyanobacteriota bacterium]
MAQAIRWYENEQRGLGLRFLSALRDACDRIEDWPRAAPRIHDLPDDLDVRRFPTPGFPYQHRLLSYRTSYRDPGGRTRCAETALLVQERLSHDLSGRARRSAAARLRWRS